MATFALWPVAVLVTVASIIDVRYRRVPNWLTGPFLVAGMTAWFAVAGWSGFGHSAAGVAIAVAVSGVFCMLGGLGMGDLKLCAATGAWLGPDRMVIALVVTGIAGGVIAVAWAACRGVLGESLDSTSGVLASWKTGIRPHPTVTLANKAKLKIPYAPAIALGALFSFLTS